MATETKFDFAHGNRVNLNGLYFLGLWPQNANGYKLNGYCLYTIISVGFLMTAHNFFRVMNIFFVISDLSAVAEIIFLTCTDVLASIKTFVFIYNIKTLKILFQTLNTATCQPKSLMQKKVCLYESKIWAILTLTIFGIAVIVFTKWTITPLLHIENKSLPFLAWYPFDTQKRFFYELTFIHQSIGFLLLATANVNIDAFIAYLMLYVESQLQILMDNLKMKHWSSDFNANLMKCMEHHKLILR